MAAGSRRSYHSALREEQARLTRDRILDALTALLADRRADDITTQRIAERAGVSQPTVYRYLPDRTALLNGMTERINELAASRIPHDADVEVDPVRRTVMIH